MRVVPGIDDPDPSDRAFDLPGCLIELDVPRSLPMGSVNLAPSVDDRLLLSFRIGCPINGVTEC